METKNNLQKLGEIIRLHRKEKRLSMFDLAGLTGTTINTIHRIETARVKPSRETLIRIAQILEINEGEHLLLMENRERYQKGEISKEGIEKLLLVFKIFPTETINFLEFRRWIVFLEKVSFEDLEKAEKVFKALLEEPTLVQLEKMLIAVRK